MKDNGVFLSPDGKHLVATTVSGSVSFFDAKSGKLEKTYDPPSAAGDIVRSHSGIAFTTENSDEKYMVYSIVENEDRASSMT